VNVHLARHTDMRKGLDELATLIQEHLKKDPVSGHLFVFTKRMDHGSFWWPRAAERGSSVTLTPA
jgi:transposase